MNKTEIKKALSKRQAGSFCRVVVNRPAEVRLEWLETAGEIRKETEYRFQLTRYPHRKPVADAVKAGTRQPPKLPSWVARSEIAPNGLKFWIGFNKQTYLALPVFGENSKFKVSWYRNGKKVPFRSVRNFLTAKEINQLAKVQDEKVIRESQGQAVARGVLLANVKAIL